MFANASTLISRSSRSLYIFDRNRNFCSRVCMSVARPVRPTNALSPIWKIFFISHPMVWFRMPYRLSLAMAMQSLPAIAMTAAPLYCMMLDMAPRPRGDGPERCDRESRMSGRRWARAAAREHPTDWPSKAVVRTARRVWRRAARLA
jgi:hypothetical protein